MFGANDSKTIWECHTLAAKAGFELRNIEYCKTDIYAMKLRAEARLYFQKGRQKLRVLKAHIDRKGRKVRK